MKRTTKKPQETSPKNSLLSFDGGGIRGLISAKWVTYLESQLKGRACRDVTGILAGTSTGSIIAAALAIGLPASDLVTLYRERGREIFPAAATRRWSRFKRSVSQGLSAPRYSEEGLEKVLKDCFKKTRLGDASGALLLIPSYNTFTRQAKVFKSNKDEHKSLMLWEVVKSSCSAPAYFPAHLLQMDDVECPLIDGGVVANNPTACAIAELVRMSPEETKLQTLRDIVVGSFGTGQTTRAIVANEAREWGALEWAIPVIDVLFDGAADAVDYIAEQLVPEGNYIRCQTKLDHAYDDMDNADATNLAALLALSQRFLDDEGGALALQKLAKKLLV